MIPSVAFKRVFLFLIMRQTFINKICVCGAGTMGSGIAQVAALHGFETLLYDVEKSVLEQAKASIKQNVQILVEKNKLSAKENEDLFNRLFFTNDREECKADLIIEAIVEKYDAKITLFQHLAGINPPDTILASNTSSLSVSELAKEIPSPERVAGMHFFNPAPVMKLVEVVKGLQTSDETIESICFVSQRMGKTPVQCKDTPGFIVNHVARPYYIESLRLVEQGLADFYSIDTLLESTGFKMGPFKLMDLIGNDINFAVSCSVYEQLGQPERLRPSAIQEQKVQKGELGKKTGKGYYSY
jgi:3-hydroxybutyryl-CoA dehydrogenase